MKKKKGVSIPIKAVPGAKPETKPAKAKPSIAAMEQEIKLLRALLRLYLP